MSKPLIFVAVDIEGTGDRFDAPIAAIGCVVGDENGQVLDKKTWCVLLEEDDIEPRCKTEFWDKQKGLWQRIRNEARPAPEVAQQFVRFWDELEVRFPLDKFKFKILSDNPSYDISRIDYFVWQHTKRYPIRYTSDGRYRSVEDPSEQAYGTSDEEGCWKRAAEKQVHNHWPSDDAHFIYNLAMEVKKLIRK